MWGEPPFSTESKAVKKPGNHYDNHRLPQEPSPAHHLIERKFLNGPAFPVLQLQKATQFKHSECVHSYPAGGTVDIVLLFPEKIPGTE